MERLFLGTQTSDTCLAKFSARAVSRSAAAAVGRGVSWTCLNPQSGRWVWYPEFHRDSGGAGSVPDHEERRGIAHHQGGHSCSWVSVFHQWTLPEGF